MDNLVEVNSEVHKNLRINPGKAEIHGANLRLIPAVVPEFTNLAVQYPIVLVKNGDTGQFVFSAMLGFEEQENLFWQNEQWDGLYIPLQIQRQPFFLGVNDNQSSQANQDANYAVCIDSNSPMITDFSDSNSEPLFAENGAESDYFLRSKQSLIQLFQGEVQNENLLTLLNKFELLQPLSVEVTFINEQRTRLNGLYTIDQEKLANLPDECLIELHKNELLQPIYTMIASLGQIYALIERKNALLRQ